jgi:hypothetical protein
VSLLEYAKDVCFEVGLEPPSSIVNNEDDDAKRLLSLFNTEGVRLMRRYPWQVLTTEKVFTAVASEDQGLLSAIAADVDRILPDTLFNRTSRLDGLQNTSPSTWQRDQARNAGLRCDFRLRGGHLLMHPAPAATDTIAFEYITANWAADGDGEPKASFTADTDVSRLDADILKLGVKWRLRKVLGGDWQADFQEFTEQLRLRFGDDTPQGTINMGDEVRAQRVTIAK